MGLWTVGGSGVDVHDNAYNNLGDGGAEGQSHINLGGDNGGSISQVISGLIPGNSYRLDFNYALHNLAGGQATAWLWIAGLNASFTATIDGSVAWTSASYNFTATSSSETLIFTGISSNGVAGAGVLLNAFRSRKPRSGVVTALPETPRNSSTLLVESSSSSDRIWNVNPDNDSVSVMSAAGTLLAEIAVGDKPWSLAKDPGSNRVFTTNKLDGSISIIDTTSLSVIETVPLPFSSQPHGIAFNSTGSEYYVVLEAIATVEKRNATTHAVTGSTPLTGVPRHIAVAFDDSRLLVSNFITPPAPGESTAVVDLVNANAEVFVIDPASMGLSNTIALSNDNRALSESAGPGLPNYLNAPVISFDNEFAYVPSKKDNIGSGFLRSNPGMTFESTVRANGSRIVLGSESEDAIFRVDFDNASLATGAALTGDSRYLLISLETSRELSVYDTVNNFEVMRLPTGRAPQGVALSSDGSIAYVHNFMDRSVSRFDLTMMLQTDLPFSNVLPSINVVTTEALTSTVLNGKQLFYDAADDRLSRDNYMSCASCHNEGDSDGRVWDLSSLGEGLRKTISLQGKGVGHGRLHRTGNFDEVQDFEGQIRSLSLGTGLMDQADFDATSDPMGAPKTGLSGDLDALAAYVNSLTEFPSSPFRDSPASMSVDALAGGVLFNSQGCSGCHMGSVFTDSSQLVLHDIGTIDVESGNRLNSTLFGFDTPTIIGIWKSPPYMHDGSAQTIADAISQHNGINLTADELGKLTEFIQQVGVVDLPLVVDSDGDGVIDSNDAFPLDPTESVDTDGDGDGNNSDTDDDNDGQSDADELSCGSNPLDAGDLSPDNDADGLPDCVDPDDDNDGTLDGDDSCPLNPDISTGPNCGGGLDFNVVSTSSHSNQDAAGNVSVADNGSTLVLTDNTWRQTGQTSLLPRPRCSSSISRVRHRAKYMASALMRMRTSSTVIGSSVCTVLRTGELRTLRPIQGVWFTTRFRWASTTRAPRCAWCSPMTMTLEPAMTVVSVMYAYSTVAMATSHPTLPNPGNQVTLLDSSVNLQVGATDQNSGDILTFSATDLPTGLSISDDGVISGNATALGSFNVTVTVDDGNGGSSDANFSWSIYGPNATCPDCLDFNVVTTSSHSNQDVAGNVSVADSGTTLVLTDNTWRQTDQTFTITATTMLEFDFQSTVQGEVQGIGFDEDEEPFNDVRIFHLYGTQNWNLGNSDFAGYSGGVVHYQIPVGQY